MNPTETAALYYHPEGFDTSRDKLMGRHVAGESFLSAFSQLSAHDTLYSYASKREHAEDMLKRVRGYGSRKAVSWISPVQPQALERAGCLFLPGPALDQQAWQRRFTGQRAYSLCGVTHTTSSDRTMDSIGQWLIAPVQPWDAVICTSQAVKKHVENLLANQSEYLAHRLNAPSPAVSLQLPVIPLGIRCEAFDPPDKAELRKSWRETLQIEDDHIAVLFVGRLSFHAKAHPYAMFAALEKAAQRTGKTIHLIMAGWFANDFISRQFSEGAQTFCPSVRTVFLDGRKPEVRHAIWFAADIHTSLSENIQETFGITPIEAMAAGLPSVVTDWDGYKETVREGVDGYRIPTLLPPAGSGLDFAYRYFAGQDDYDRYIGQVSQCTSVDIEQAAEAFADLINHPEKREEMGRNARQRALDVYDWRVIIPAYEELWTELAAIRRAETSVETAPLQGPAPHPLRDDPMRMFSHYASDVLRRNHAFSLSEMTREQSDAARGLKMNDLGQDTVLPAEIANKILEVLQAHPASTVETLARILQLPPATLPQLSRTLIWLHKLGAVRVTSGE